MKMIISISPISNLTINNLYQTKFIDHSPFYSFSKNFFSSNIQLSKVISKQFSSPQLTYYSSLKKIQVSQSSFLHFIFTPLCVNEEYYNRQHFSNYINQSTNTIFTNCIFQIDYTNNCFIHLSNNQFVFDYCQFINSTINGTSLIELNLYQVSFKYSIFLNIHGNGPSNIIHAPSLFDEDSFKIEYSNITTNSVEGNIFFVGGSILCLNHCLFLYNNCSSNLIYLSFADQVIETNILNDVIILKNQSNPENTPSEILVICKRNRNPVNINQVVINNEMLNYSHNYYHISLSDDENFPVNLNNCCFSNPKEYWTNAKIDIDYGNRVKYDCVDAFPTNIHYGIIGDETIVLRVPRRLLTYFPDSDSE